MFVVVLLLMVTFGSSQRLATAYGVSVTGALLIDTLLLLIVARALFHWPTWKLVLAAVAFGGTEATFLGANLTKILHGGWLPLLIAAVMFTVMTTLATRPTGHHPQSHINPTRDASSQRTLGAFKT